MIVVLLVLILIGVAALVGLVGSDVAHRQRAERARVDRVQRKAERKLHDLSRQAFDSMLAAARSVDPREHPWRG